MSRTQDKTRTEPNRRSLHSRRILLAFFLPRRRDVSFSGFKVWHHPHLDVFLHTYRAQSFYVSYIMSLPVTCMRRIHLCNILRRLKNEEGKKRMYQYYRALMIEKRKSAEAHVIVKVISSGSQPTYPSRAKLHDCEVIFRLCRSFLRKCRV